MKLNEAKEAICDAQSEDYFTRVNAIEGTDWMEVAHLFYAENERLRSAGTRLLSVLPDSVAHENPDCWKWCWDELDGESQDEVKEARNVWAKALGGEQ